MFVSFVCSGSRCLALHPKGSRVAVRRQRKQSSFAMVSHNLKKTFFLAEHFYEVVTRYIIFPLSPALDGPSYIADQTNNVAEIVTSVQQTPPDSLFLSPGRASRFWI
jgi:hypothetical protein